MTTAKQFSPPRQLLDPGFAVLLHSYAQQLGTVLLIWSREPALIFSSPPTPAPDLAGRALALAHRSMAEGQPLQEPSPEGELLAVPILGMGGIVGVITAEAARSPQPVLNEVSGPGPLNPGSRPALEMQLDALAQALGRHLELAGIAAEQAIELTSLRNELGLLRHISALLTHPENTQQTVEFILHQGCAATAAEMGMVQLPEARVPIVYPSLSGAARGLEVPERTLRLMAGKLWWRVRDCEGPSIHGRLDEILGGEAGAAGPVHVAAHRIHPENPKAGFLAFMRPGTTPFSRHELRLIHSLAAQISLAVRSADLYEDLGQFLMSTVKALVSTIEAKDHYTSGHSSRVNVISMLLGKQLGMSRGELEALNWASILHDVGKIGMPEAILNKPGRLAPSEYEVVKQHPWRGYAVVSHIGQLKTASQGVLFHHERIDGGGYPLGISGSAIPPIARIIAVADTFDALTSTRPYRTARKEEEAFAEIQRVRGTQLDPRVVDTLGEMVPFLKEHRVMLESAGQAA
jgi:HD-GYP domain-containing protein (c-di-GMP phosphodiesterase class II)